MYTIIAIVALMQSPDFNTAGPQSAPTAKAAAPAAKKCCPDCTCGDDCQCAYPGQCLIRAAKPAYSKIEITECYGDHCETRIYEPLMQGTETGKLYKIEPAGTWELGKAPGVRGWSKKVFRAATAPVQQVLGRIESACANGQCGRQMTQQQSTRGYFFRGRR
jgi:hypothetical protein